MTSIVIGGGLGVVGSSATQVNGYGASGQGKVGQGNDLAIVNAATGNLIIQSQDDFVASLGVDDSLLRTYNSQGILDGDNNDGWRLSLYRSLTVNGDGTLTRTAADGHQELFTGSGGVWRSAEGETGAAHDVIRTVTTPLGSVPTEAYEYEAGGSGVFEMYDSSGKLLGWRDTSNNVTTLSYTGSLVTGVTDSSGQTVTLVYSGTNLQSIQINARAPGSSTLATQTRVTYSYDGQNRLSQIRVDLTPENTADSSFYYTTYQYDGASNRVSKITQSTDQAGVSVNNSLSITYVQQNGVYRVFTLSDAANRSTQFHYDLTNGRTDVTDSLGNVTSYYRDTQGRLVSILSPDMGGGKRTLTSYQYDANNNITAVTDADGRAVHYAYDANGNVTEVRDQTGNTIRRIYDANNRLLAETVFQTKAGANFTGSDAASPLTTHYAYDSNQRLNFVVTPEGRVTRYIYNAAGQRTSTLTYTGTLYTTATTYSGTPSFPLATGFDYTSLNTWATSTADKSKIERSDTTYDLTGQVQTVTTYQSVDANGNGVATNASTTRYVYDFEGRLRMQIDPRASSAMLQSTTAYTSYSFTGTQYVTSYAYDGLDRQIKLQSAQVANASTISALTAYDDANNKISVTLAGGLQTVTTYSKSGDKLSVTNTGPNSGALGTTNYYYDANGWLRMAQDPTGARTFYFWDAQGRQVGVVKQVTVIDPTTGVSSVQGELTETVYGDAGQQLQQIQYATRISSAVMASLVDGSGNPVLSADLFTVRGGTRPDVAPAIDLDSTSTVAGRGYRLTYNAPGTAVSVVNSTALNVNDNSTITSAQVILGGAIDGPAESLAVTVSGGLTASYNSSTGILTISGSASAATYQAVLRTLTYQNVSQVRTIGDRTLDITVSDGFLSSNIATSVVTIATPPLPVVDLNGAAAGTGYTAAFTEGSGAVAVVNASALTVVADGDAYLLAATITLTNRPDGGAESLAVSLGGSGLSASYSSDTGVLLINGQATAAVYQSVLRTLIYNNTSSTPTTTARTISVTVSDGQQNSAVVTSQVSVTAVNNPPLVLGVGSSAAAFTEGGAAVAFASGVSLSDADNANLSSATVAITNLQDGTAESLAVTLGSSGLSQSYNSATGVLTLSGSASVATYQSVLRTLVYNNTSSNPGTVPRAISLKVNDGGVDSNTAVTLVTVTSIDNPPVLTGGGNTSAFTEGGGAITATVSSLVISDVDSPNLLSATITLTNRPDGTAESLSVDLSGTTGLAQSYNSSTGVLTIIGAASQATYQTLLSSKIKYNNLSQAPNTATRTLSLAVSDGKNSSAAITSSVSVAAVNTAPLVLGVGSSAASFSQGGAAVALASGLTISDVDSTNLSSATISITNLQDGTAESLAVTLGASGLSQSYNSATGILTLSGSATVATYQSVLRSLTYNNTAAPPNATIRVINVKVNDGATNSNTVATLVTVSPTYATMSYAAPVLAGGGNVNAFSESDETITVSIDSLAISDSDSADMLSATVTLINRPDGTAESLSVDLSGTTDLVQNYDSSTGVLTILGSASKTTYQDLLANKLQYNNSSPTPNTATRNISVVVNDGRQNSAAVTTQVSIATVNTAPTIIGVGSSAAAFTEGGAAVAFASGVSLSDADSTNLSSATIAITNPQDGSSESLAVTLGSSGLSQSYNSSTGVLTLSGSASVATYQSVLRTLVYNNTSSNPGTAPRAISLQVNDGGVDSNTAVTLVTVASIDNPPALTGGGNTSAFTEGGGAITAAVSSLVISDVDSPNLLSAAITLTNRPDGTAESLSVDLSGTTGLAQSYNSSTGVLTILGSASVATYQTLLSSKIKYNNLSQNPTTTNRTISVTVNDGQQTSAAVTSQVSVTAVNNAPVADLSGSGLQSSTNIITPASSSGNVTQVFPQAQIYDPDSAGLSSVTIALVSPQLGATIAVTVPGNITGVTVTGNGTSSINISTNSGSTVTAAQYTQILRTLNFSGGLIFTNIQQINVTLNDGVAAGVQSKAFVVPGLYISTAPTIGGQTNAAFVEGAGPVNISSGLTVTNPLNSSQVIYSATVWLPSDSHFDGDSEVLAVNVGATGLLANYNSATGELIVSGAASIATYQSVLRTVTYNNTSQNPTTTARSVRYTATDGKNVSASVWAGITVTAVNNPPQLWGIGSSTTAFTEGGAAVAFASGVSLSDADSANLSSATIAITNLQDGTAESLAVTLGSSGLSQSYNSTTGVLTLSGGASVETYQSVLRTLVYNNTSSNPGTAPRAISLKVNDGSVDSNTAVTLVTVTSIDNPPVLTGGGNTSAFTEGGGAITAEVSGLSISGVESPNLLSATITLTNRPDGTAESLSVDLSGTTGLAQSYNSSTGVLTIIGAASQATYQTLLSSKIQYNNLSQTPNTASRTLSLTVSDGKNSSAAITSNVSVTAVDDAPLILGVGSSAAVFYQGGAAVTVASSLALSDVDNVNLSSATVAISNLLDGTAESLAVTLGSSGLTQSYNTATGVLTLSGSASVATYQTVLRTLTYRNTATTPTITPREISFTVNDGSLDSNAASGLVTITPYYTAPTYAAPVLAGGGNISAFTEGNGAITASVSGLTITDSDSANLLSATITLTNRPDGTAESLSVDLTGTTGLAQRYDSSTGILTIIGSASKATYQTLLSSKIKYNNTSQNPATTARMISVVVSDGQQSSAAVTAQVSVTAVNTAPLVLGVGAGASAFTEGGAAVGVAANITLSDVDSATFTSATVSITNLRDGTAESLAVTVGASGLTASYNSSTGVLTLTGSASQATYQTVLRTLTYNNTSKSPNATARVISIKVNDGAIDSNIVTTLVTVTPVYTAPVLSGGGNTSAFTEGGGAITASVSGLTIADLDSPNLLSATVTLSSQPDGAAESLSVDLSGTSGLVQSYDSSTGVLTILGSASVATYQTLLLSKIKYNNLSQNPTTTNRTISVVVNDGQQNSAAVTSQVSVTAVNIAPLVALSSTSIAQSNNGQVTFAGVGTATILAPSGSISDVDSPYLSSLTAVISNPLSTESLSVTIPAALTSLVTVAGNNTPSLTITITAGSQVTPSQWTSILRAVVYNNSVAVQGYRQVKVAANDGASSSTQSSVFVVVAAPVTYTAPTSYAAASAVAAVVGGSTSVTPLLASSSDRTSKWLYDRAGRLIYTIDAAGYAIQYSYDGAGRKIAQTEYANALLPGNPPPTNGRSEGFTVPADAGGKDRTTRYFYDGDGRALATLDAAGYLTENLYDAAGQLTKTIGYVTLTAAGQRASGTLSALRPTADANNDHVSYFFYNAEGQLTAQIDPNGYVSSFQYTLAGQQSGKTQYYTPVSYNGTQTLSQILTAASIPTGTRTNDNDQIWSWSYDALGRVTQQIDNQGTVTQSVYDAVTGLLTSQTTASGTSDARTTTYQYDDLGRVTNALTGRGSASLGGGNAAAWNTDGTGTAYGHKSIYDLAGRKIESIDPNGHKTFYYYNQDSQLVYTVDGTGAVTQSVYDAFGEVKQVIQYSQVIDNSALKGGLITDSGNAAFVATVTATSFLNDAKNRATSYVYSDGRGLLTTTTDASGYSTVNAYDAFGDLTTQVVDVSTSGTPGATTRTDQYQYDARGLKTQGVQDVGGLNLTTKVLQYDAFGRAKQTQDANGNITNVNYNDHLGRVVTVTDPLSKTTVTTYDAFGRTISLTDRNGNTTSYSYTDGTQTMKSTTPEGVVTSIVTNRFGQKISITTGSATDGTLSVTVYVYDKDGNLTDTIVDQGSGHLNLTTQNTYDNTGLLKTFADANGTQTTYQYDAANRVLQRTVDPTGLNLKTQYVYNAFGQAYQVIDANGITTETVFDKKGEATAVIVDAVDQPGQPGTALKLATLYTYDARGLTLTVQEGMQATGSTGSWTFAAAASTTPKVTQYVYDKAGRRTSQIVDPGSGKLNITTLYAYDKNGNMVRKTDANLNVWRSLYNAGDQLIYSVDPLGDVTQYVYDGNGQTVKTVRYATALSASALSALSDASTSSAVTAPTSTSQDQVSWMVYDKDGRKAFDLQSLDGVHAAVTGYVYDKAGRVTDVVRYYNTATISGIPAIPNKANFSAPATDARDEHTRSVYDTAGRSIYSVDAMNDVVGYVYDNNGNVIKKYQYASQPVSGIQYNSDWLNSGANLAKNSTYDRVTRYVYDAAGRQVYTLKTVSGSDTSYTAYVTESDYDNVGRVTGSIAYANAATMTSDVASLSNVQSAITLNADNDQATYTAYLSSGFVESVTDAEGYAESYTYDGVGNRIALLNKLGNQWNYSYDAAGRMTEEDTPQVTVTSIGTQPGVPSGGATTATASIVTKIVYDGLGNVLEKIENAGAADKTQSRVTSFRYDALGRQVRSIKGDVYHDPISNVNYGSNVGIYNAAADAGASANSGYGSSLNPGDISSLATRGGFESNKALVSDAFYDSFGNAIVGRTLSSVDSSGNPIYSYTYKIYDASHRLAYEIDAGRNVTQYTYDSFGNQASLTRFNSPAINDSQDGSLVALESSLNGILSSTASGQGLGSSSANSAMLAAQAKVVTLVSAISSVDSRQITTTYDQLNRKILVEQPATDYYTTSTGGAAAANVPGQQQVRPAAFYAYNAFSDLTLQGNLIAPQPAQTPLNPLAYPQDWATTYFGYDKLGNQTDISDALNYYTKNQYDAFGRLQQNYQYAKAATNAPTAAGNNVWTFTEPAWLTPSTNDTAGYDRVTGYGYDRMNRQTSVVRSNTVVSELVAGQNTIINSDSYVTYTDYDALGNVIAATDAEGNITRSYYDELGRLIATAAPSRTTQSPNQSASLRASGIQYEVVTTPSSFLSNPSTAKNHIYASWDSLESWGSGDVVATLFYDSGFGIVASISVTKKALQGNTGATFNFPIGASSIVKVVVQKYIGSTLVQAYDSSSGIQYQVLSKKASSFGNPLINQVSASWGSLQSLGSGDVRATLTYTADSNGTQRSISKTVSSSVGDTGVTFDWNSDTLKTATRVVVEKWVGSSWVPVYDSSGVTRQIEIGNLQTTLPAGSTVQFSYVSSTNPSISGVVALQKIGNFWIAKFPVGMSIGGAFTYKITAKDSSGTILDLTPDVAGAPEIIGEATVAMSSGKVSMQVTGGSTTVTPLTTVAYDALGNVVSQTNWSNGAVQSDWYNVQMGAASAQDQITYKRYDNLGRQIEQVDANGNSVFQSYDAWGHVVRVWQAQKDRLFTTGAIQKTTLYQYDVQGHQTATVQVVRSPDDANNVYKLQATIAEYNAFGEQVKTYVTANSVYNAPTATYSHSADDLTEYAEYDSNGHVWQTNAKDGVDKVYRYDLAGNQTAVVMVPTASGYASTPGLKPVSHHLGHLSDLGNLTDVIETDTVYDKLGRSVKQLQQSFTQSTNSYSPLQLSVTDATYSGLTATSVTSSSFGFYNQYYTYSLNVAWSSLSAYGTGSVSIVINYTLSNGSTGSKTLSNLSSAVNDVGGVITWDGSQVSNVGSPPVPGPQITSITSITVKKVVSGSTLSLRQGANATGIIELTIPKTLTGVTYTGGFTVAGVTSPSYTVSSTSNVYQISTTPGSIADGVYQYSLTLQDALTAQSYGTYTGTMTVSGGHYSFGPAATSTELLTPTIIQTVDRWGNVLSSTDPGSSTNGIYYRYNDRNQVIFSLPLENTNSATNATGISETNTSVDAGLVQYFYNARGDLVQTNDAAYNVHQRSYDEGGQLVAEYSFTSGTASNVTKYLYDALGRKIQTIDPNGNITSFAYDHLNQLTQQQNQLTAQQSLPFGGLNPDYTYQYDEVGNRISATDGISDEITKYRYNSVGQLITELMPLATGLSSNYKTSYQYDQYGNKVNKVDGNGLVQTWSYDWTGRLLSKTGLESSDSPYLYSYDGYGRLFAETENTHNKSLTYAYYQNGWLKSITDDTNDTLTYYEYDEAGHHTRELFMSGGDVYQDARLSYDSQGHLISDRDLQSYVTYRYDAVGNRREVTVKYQKDVTSSPTTVDYWYTYDQDNRILIAEGKLLSNGTIGIDSTQGSKLSYDANGNRAQDETYVSGTHVYLTYSYDYADRLVSTKSSTSPTVPGNLTSTRTYDLAGRVTQYQEYNSSGNISGTDQYIYNLNGWVLQQKHRNSDNSVKYAIGYVNNDPHTNRFDSTDADNPGGAYNRDDTTYAISRTDGGLYDFAGNLKKYFYVSAGNFTASYKYTYAHADSYKVAQIHVRRDSDSHTGDTIETYDSNGNLSQLVDTYNSSAPTRDYVVDTQGKILSRTDSNGKTQNYYFANNVQVASIGTIDANKFDFNYTPVSSSYPSTIPGQYVLQSGDTLESIALNVFGDSSLWYLIADANGLAGNSDLNSLAEGTTLRLPNSVTNIHNSSDTFTPYDPSKAIGDTTPTIKPVPKDRCQLVTRIIGGVVAAIVNYIVAAYFGPQAGAFAGAIAGYTTTETMGAMLNGRYSIGRALQGGLGLTMIKDGAIFNPKSLFTIDGMGKILNDVGTLDPLTAGDPNFSYGTAIKLGLIAAASSYAGAVVGQQTSGLVGAIARNVVSQELNIAVGLQGSFSWTGVAATALFPSGGGASSDGFSFSSFGNIDWGKVAVDTAVNTAINFGVGVVSQYVEMAIHDHGTLDFANIAADAFGNALGNSIVGAMNPKPAAQGGAFAHVLDDDPSRAAQNLGGGSSAGSTYNLAAGGGATFTGDDYMVADSGQIMSDASILSDGLLDPNDPRNEIIDVGPRDANGVGVVTVAPRSVSGEGAGDIATENIVRANDVSRGQNYPDSGIQTVPYYDSGVGTISQPSPVPFDFRYPYDYRYNQMPDLSSHVRADGGLQSASSAPGNTEDSFNGFVPGMGESMRSGAIAAVRQASPVSVEHAGGSVSVDPLEGAVKLDVGKTTVNINLPLINQFELPTAFNARAINRSTFSLGTSATFSVSGGTEINVYKGTAHFGLDQSFSGGLLDARYQAVTDMGTLDTHLYFMGVKESASLGFNEDSGFIFRKPEFKAGYVVPDITFEKPFDDE